MRVIVEERPYKKGMVLEAAMLNRDFALDRFLLAESLARLSDGIVSGLNTVVRDGALVLERGVFRLDGALGWLLEDMELEWPPEKQLCQLCLAKETENVWKLAWQAEPGDALVLCRVKMLDRQNLRNSFHRGGVKERGLQNWLTYLKGVDYIQLEYAMAASCGKRPTLLPALLQTLAPFVKAPELKIWFMNGLFPMLDYFGVNNWQEALDSLAAEVRGAPQQKKAASDDEFLL